MGSRLARVMLASLSALAVVPLPGQGELSVRTGVVVLVDYSKSFAPYRKEVHGGALAELNTALADLAVKVWPKPVSFSWAAISTTSLLAVRPCGDTFTFTQKLIEKLPQENQVTNSAGLRTRLEACRVAVMVKSQSAEDYTDISGAITGAAESLKTSVDHKILIVLSDFEEDLPEGHASSSFKLSGEIVVLLYLPTREQAQAPDTFFAHLDEWQARLLEAGAARVCRQPVLGLTVGNVSTCLIK